MPPVLETPGIKQIQKNPEIFPEPKVNLPFDKNSSDSPAVPVFQTPGIKQIAMVAPCQSHGERKKAVVGLFKEEGVTGIKQEPVAPRLNTTYMIEEPQPPDLTYNLEVSFINYNFDTIDVIYNTELNDLRKIVSLRKSDITVERISVLNVIENLMEHGIYGLQAPIAMTS